MVLMVMVLMVVEVVVVVVVAAMGLERPHPCTPTFLYIRLRLKKKKTSAVSDWARDHADRHVFPSSIHHLSLFLPFHVMRSNHGPLLLVTKHQKWIKTYSPALIGFTNLPHFLLVFVHLSKVSQSGESSETRPTRPHINAISSRTPSRTLLDLQDDF